MAHEDKIGSGRSPDAGKDERDAAIRRAREKIAELPQLRKASAALQDRVLSELGVEEPDTADPALEKKS